MSFNLKSNMLEKKKKKKVLICRLDLLLQQNRKVKTYGKDPLLFITTTEIDRR